MIDFAYLIPALPLLGFVVLAVFGKRLGDPRAGWIGFAAVGLAFLATLVTWLGLLTHVSERRQYTKTIFDWIHIGSFDAKMSLLVDPLSLTMALFVSGVSALIHLYSIGYMKADPRFHQFFIYLNLFVFSMLMLVLGDNLLITFLGWEGVGACSYLLVGFWFERHSAATAAKKAFVVNRVGDAGFLLGIFLTFTALGSITYFGDNGFLNRLPALGEGTITAIALLVFVGAIGKSAQLPLHVWLPDAMEGPTPVSALIHAATMVTAGVYLMARLAPMLALSHAASLTVAIVGGASALFAATIACAQNDIKRVLAYSTMSQLGYMFMAVGAAGATFAIFHMVTHAFFKALLFMGAGAVIHSLHEQQDLKFMGNLRKYLPWTFPLFLVGYLALSGIFPFAGFWSKDEILLSLWTYNKALFGIGLGTVFLTAYYMTRLFAMTFFGKQRYVADDHGHGVEPHESPKTMVVPMVVLGVLSVLGGLLQVTFLPFKNVLENFLDPVFGPYSRHAEVLGTTKWTLAIAGMAVALLGIGTAVAVARRASNPTPENVWPARLEPKVLGRAWFVDTLYEWVFEKPGNALANFNSSFVDARVIDGAVNGSARLVAVTGAGLRRMQNGLIRSYALAIALGTLLMLVWVLIRSAR